MKILGKICSLVLIIICFSFSLSNINMEVFGDMEYNITVTGGKLSNTSESYNESTGYKLDFDGTETFLKIENEVIDSLSTFDTVIIEFRMKYEGTGYNNTLKVYKTEGDLVDYGYPGDTWNRVKFKTLVYTENGKNFVKVEIDFEEGKSVCISDLKVEKSEKDGPLFGGVTLYSMESSTLAMGYVLVTPDDKVIVIDGGNSTEPANFLKFIRSITNKVDYWLITHFHVDHMSVLLTLLKNEYIYVENLYYDFPTTNTAKTLSGDSDSYICDELPETIKKYPDKVKNVITPHKGDVYTFGEYITVKVLNDAWFEKNNNYGNNSSIMYKVETPGEDILFTGDMGDRGDYYLEDEWTKSEIESCTVIQMAHHGQNGVTDYFYSVIKEIKVCLYPAVQWIYDNDGGGGFNSANLKTLHTRDLMRERGVMRIYTSIGGRKIIL